MTVTESRPADLVKLKVEFIKPYEGSNVSEFSFKPDGNGTAVTWNSPAAPTTSSPKPRAW